MSAFQPPYSYFWYPDAASVFFVSSKVTCLMRACPLRYITARCKKTPEVAHLLLTPASGGWSFSDAEVVVAAGNHGDRYLPVRAQGSSSQRELAALRQRAANSTEASQAPRPYCILQCSYVSWDTVNSTLTYITVTYVPRGIKHRACLPQTVILFMKPILNDKWKTVFRNEHKTTHGNRFKDKSIILKF